MPGKKDKLGSSYGKKTKADLWPLYYLHIHGHTRTHRQIIHVVIYKFKSSTLEPSKTCFSEMGTLDGSMVSHNIELHYLCLTR